MRFGVLVLQNAPWPEMVRRFQQLEQWGFDSGWVADHYLNYHRPDEEWLDGWGALAGLARETHHVRLGTLVSSITLRNPAVLARQAVTLDVMSNGRLELGIGSAGTQADFEMTGTGPWSRGERYERLAESVAIVDALLRGDVVDHEGHYRIKGARVRPRPVQLPRPPLTIAALGPKAMRLAASVADSWSSYPVTGTGRVADSTQRLTHEEALRLTRERVGKVSRFCLDAGRDPATLRKSFLSLLGYTDPLPDPSRFAEYVNDYRQAGIDELIVYWPQQTDQEERLAAIAQELPNLR